MLIKNLDELEQLVLDIKKKLKGDELIFLEGELGAGKTTFTKMLFKHLGVKGIVNSPTFVIMKQYNSEHGLLTHIDAYQLKSVDDIYDDLFANNIRVVEWASNIKMDINCDLKITLKYISDNEREVELIWKN